MTTTTQSTKPKGAAHVCAHADTNGIPPRDADDAAPERAQKSKTGTNAKRTSRPAALSWVSEPLTPAQVRGQRIAINLLDYLEQTAGAADACSIQSGEDGQVYRKKPQYNIIFEGIDKCAGERETLEGFAAVLSDFVSSAARAGAPDAALYERILADAIGVQPCRP